MFKNAVELQCNTSLYSNVSIDRWLDSATSCISTEVFGVQLTKKSKSAIHIFAYIKPICLATNLGQKKVPGTKMLAKHVVYYKETQPVIKEAVSQMRNEVKKTHVHNFQINICSKQEHVVSIIINYLME